MIFEHGNSFATFWAGKQLSAFEVACLRSFVIRGHSIALYSFEGVENAPEGVALLDASAIAPRDTLDRFLYAGETNYAHFADYFRYLLFRETDLIWVDTDILLIRPVHAPLKRMVLGLERPGSLNNAVMRLDNAGPELDRVIGEAAAAMGRDLHWGEIGPRLVSKVYGQAFLLGDAFAPKFFYPIAHDDFWKVLLPEHLDECERLCADAFTVHLWNNILERLGVWKMLAPPEGSFLHRRFDADGSLPFFSDIYPERVMRSMIENWRLRKDGGDLGIAKLSRQVVPSVFRTLRHHSGGRLFRSAK